MHVRRMRNAYRVGIALHQLNVRYSVIDFQVESDVDSAAAELEVVETARPRLVDADVLSRRLQSKSRLQSSRYQAGVIMEPQCQVRRPVRAAVDVIQRYFVVGHVSLPHTHTNTRQ